LWQRSGVENARYGAHILGMKFGRRLDTVERAGIAVIALGLIIMAAILISVAQ